MPDKIEVYTKERGLRMSERNILSGELSAFCLHLQEEEKSSKTIEKYLRDVRTFLFYAAEKNVTKELTISYKKSLEEQGYALRSINSMLASLNSFLYFIGKPECRVKNLRCQQQTYCTKEKELTKAEYLRLLEASKRKKQLNLILQTICSTGIRISELKYFTVEAVKRGEISVHCKSKIRTILIPAKLKNLLLSYTKQQEIKSGVIFITRNGNPVDRSNVWAQMKRLCEAAKVNPIKVFPHNLRKLFARTFYGLEKDIAKLADILGHSSINTTRIYIMTNSSEHRRRLERLNLLL